MGDINPVSAKFGQMSGQAARSSRHFVTFLNRPSISTDRHQTTRRNLYLHLNIILKP